MENAHGASGAWLSVSLPASPRRWTSRWRRPPFFGGGRRDDSRSARADAVRAAPRLLDRRAAVGGCSLRGGPARVARANCNSSWSDCKCAALADFGLLAGAGQGQMQHLKARSTSFLLRHDGGHEKSGRTNAGAGIRASAPAVGKQSRWQSSGWTLAWLWNALLIAGDRVLKWGRLSQCGTAAGVARACLYLLRTLLCLCLSSSVAKGPVRMRYVKALGSNGHRYARRNDCQTSSGV